MKPVAPAFQFYADDFIAGVADMTQSEVGAYIMLLAHGWNTRGLNALDKERIKILAKGDVSEHVFGKFYEKDGRLLNKRQEIERRKQADFRRKQKDNGSKGGRPKSKPINNPTLSSGQTQAEPKKSSPSPISGLLSAKEGEEAALAHFSEAEIPSKEEFFAYFETQACLLPAKWYVIDKWEAAESDNWKGKANWKAYARRVKGWWEADGRPMSPGKKKSMPTHVQEDVVGGRF